MRVLTLKRTGSARTHARTTQSMSQSLSPSGHSGQRHSWGARSHQPSPRGESCAETCRVDGDALSQQRTPNLCISLGMTLNRMMTSPAGSVSSRNRSADEAITSRCFNRGAPPRKKAARRGPIGGTGGQRGATLVLARGTGRERGGSWASGGCGALENCSRIEPHGLQVWQRSSCMPAVVGTMQQP